MQFSGNKESNENTESSIFNKNKKYQETLHVVTIAMICSTVISL